VVPSGLGGSGRCHCGSWRRRDELELRLAVGLSKIEQGGADAWKGEREREMSESEFIFLCNFYLKYY